MGGSVGKGEMRRVRTTEAFEEGVGGFSPFVIKALACPREGALAGPPKPGQHDNEEIKGKVQGSAEEGRHDICGIPGGIAKIYDAGNPVEGDLWEERRIA